MVVAGIDSTNSSPAIGPDLTTAITDGMAALHVPGVAIGVLHEGRETTAGFGVTNVEHPLPVTPQTLFCIASITKTFVATAAMQLVEKGLLDLNAPLRTYLPDLRLVDEDVAARVSLRHVFTHTGGWVGDFSSHTGYGEDAVARIVAELATVRQVTPLGEVYAYSNSGFYVAGRVVEVVTGKPLEDVIRQDIVDPLGMKLTCWRHRAQEVAITHRVASGHRERGGEIQVMRPWGPMGRGTAPAGGLVSTVDDLLRYARFHLGGGEAPDGHRLLRPDTMALMQTPHFATDRAGGAVCIAWRSSTVDGVRVLRHAGAFGGQMSTLAFAPERGFGVVVLTNGEYGRQLAGDVADAALRQYLGLDVHPLRPTAATEEELDRYAGTYANVAGTGLVRIERDGVGLLARSIPTKPGSDGSLPPEVARRAAQCGEDAIVILDPPFRGQRGEFLRGADGAIRWLRLVGRLHERQSMS